VLQAFGGDELIGHAFDGAAASLTLTAMIRLIGRTGTIFALCVAVGLHWTALQTIAWTTMLVTNARQTSSLAEAVGKTFDGNHPCGLCKRINSAQHSQKKPEAQATQSKFDLICTVRAVRIISSFEDLHYAESMARLHERGESPPVPPPRVALA
jgi:hypothetical protein